MTRNKRHAGRRGTGPDANYYGKHLLLNERIVREMMDKANIRPADTVLDLGAGTGAFTFALAEKAGSVIAIENDAEFADMLRRKSRGHDNITIVERDIRKAYLPKQPFCVVANIPFSITTPILKMLMDAPAGSFQRAALILDYGAAKGLTARLIRRPRLLVWRMGFDIELVKVIPRHHFAPPPSVDTAMVLIRRKALVAPKHSHTFGALAEYALKRPALPLSAALQGIFTPPQMKHLVRRLGVSRDIPACALNERQWGIVFQTMLERVEAYRWPRRQRKK
ncbi:rRNA adenine N(6)-methyltransferase family protein [Paenibacillus melissococcoides]|uniref:rRNA adenine N-6-methyltransferase n=1 Tax=Paenibacillus melissococcoides TaxID=2912268 RepID=A0ABN8UAI4_9BACL|nr:MULTISPECIES: rRNA adenine N(6)-methyltransferase family protein [Paenibacillus]MEB9898087.1 rRNA adenine N(6)-methyltransferase family protein [Bacillus cereus]CAH8246558.1 rRNA adenine N(6)-methyltransferase family protein [Paenibacillus melissococcoides]CAH8715103.1 rRNA adenine N(6)-methyltransferase family protein [Paenibacillus melissococcoides]CAH8716043.1 rRNA adenine N(6)-methyltransferase family protein [Paenibacillus melissococcoides]GIO82761.1 ribosomal RNA small subunit methylt